MRSYRRSDRVGELMLREISDIIHREVKDPRIGFCTVTRVILSDDLQYAKVYVSTMGKPEEEDKTLQGLERATRFIRHEIGQRLRLRHTPEIRFFSDKSIEHMDHISQLLKQIAQEESTKEQ